MAKGATTLSDVRESEWTQSIGTAVVGVTIMLVAALLFYFMRLWLRDMPSVLVVARVIAGLVVLVGATITGLAIYRGSEARKVEGVAVPCPYCDQEVRFLEPPTEEYVCEHCNRTVHYENGQPIPVRTIICQACHTEHRVAINVQRYVCDRCNRPLNLGAIPTRRMAAVGEAEAGEDLLQNYDVFLVAVDRRKEDEVAFKIQNLLVVNLKESRRLMGTISGNTPLMVGHALPQRKAEAIRRQLQELGATATLRPTTGVPAAPRRQ